MATIQLEIFRKFRDNIRKNYKITSDTLTDHCLYINGEYKTLLEIRDFARQRGFCACIKEWRNAAGEFIYHLRIYP